jgi:putative effector of murein hydrolase
MLRRAEPAGTLQPRRGIRAVDGGSRATQRSSAQHVKSSSIVEMRAWMAAGRVAPAITVDAVGFVQAHPGPASVTCGVIVALVLFLVGGRSLTPVGVVLPSLLGAVFGVAMYARGRVRRE